MLFKFDGITILYENAIPFDGKVVFKVSNQTMMVFVNGRFLFSFYPTGLSHEELKELLVDNFKEDGIGFLESDMERICEKICSHFQRREEHGKHE